MIRVKLAYVGDVSRNILIHNCHATLWPALWKMGARPAFMVSFKDAFYFFIMIGHGWTWSVRIPSSAREQAIAGYFAKLRDIGTAFSHGKEWNPSEIFEDLREKGLIRGPYKLIFWFGPGAWNVLDVPEGKSAADLLRDVRPPKHPLEDSKLFAPIPDTPEVRALQRRWIRQCGIANLACLVCFIPLILVQGNTNNSLIVIPGLFGLGLLGWSYRRWWRASEFFIYQEVRAGDVPVVKSWMPVRSNMGMFIVVSIWSVFFPNSLRRYGNAPSIAKRTIIRGAIACALGLTLSAVALSILSKPVREARANGDYIAQMDPKLIPLSTVFAIMFAVSLVMGLLCLVRLSSILEHEKNNKS